MKPEHPNFTHMQDKEPATPPQEIPVHHVMPPEDEAKYMAEMMALANNLPPMEGLNAPPIDDIIVQKEIEKKRSFEKLVLFKQPKTKVFDISGVNFRLKVLNVHENGQVYKKIRELPDDEQLTKSPIMLLAASLVDADGFKIEENYSGPIEITDPIMRRYYELCAWNMPIINALVTAYTQFIKEVEGEYQKNFLAKPPKTPTTD